MFKKLGNLFFTFALLLLILAPVPAVAQVFAPCDTRNGCTMQGYIFYTLGGPPVVTGTGSPTIAAGSSNIAGIVTAGASATSVIITFNVPYTVVPFCVAASYTQLAAFSFTVSKTAITITQTATSGNLIWYNCYPAQGGG